MLLFDTPAGTDRGPAKHGEPHYDYLCRTGRLPFLRVREVMESWLAQFPSHHQEELTLRLRSRDNHHFEAAFFELYLHELFRRLGYSMEVHPRAGDRNKRPDFLATENRRGALLIEAASVCEMSDAARAAQARLNTVFDALNRVHCPDYFMEVECYGTLTSPLPGGKLRHELRRFLNSLDYEAARQVVSAGGLAKLPKFEFTHDGFRLEIGVLPVSPQKRGHPEHRPLGLYGPGEVRLVDNRTPLRDKLCQKAGHYGRLRRPLLIAINAAGRHLDGIDVTEALFGKESWAFSPLADELNEPVFRRVPNGALFGPKGPRNRNVSAALFVSSLLPWTVASAQPVTYHNPWARYTVDPLPEGLAQFRSDGHLMVASGGRAVHQVLGLPEGWPHF